MGDWNASLALTAGLLAALARKDRTGEGDKVTVTYIIVRFGLCR